MRKNAITKTVQYRHRSALSWAASMDRQPGRGTHPRHFAQTLHASPGEFFRVLCQCTLRRSTLGDVPAPPTSHMGFTSHTPTEAEPAAMRIQRLSSSHHLDASGRVADKTTPCNLATPQPRNPAPGLETIYLWVLDVEPEVERDAQEVPNT